MASSWYSSVKANIKEVTTLQNTDTTFIRALLNNWDVTTKDKKTNDKKTQPARELWPSTEVVEGPMRMCMVLCALSILVKNDDAPVLTNKTCNYDYVSVLHSSFYVFIC
jgi:hypothetical protein